MLGGKHNYTAQLDSFFTIKAVNPNKHLGQEAMIGQYAHGNEPSHHIAYLYAYANKPSRVGELVTQICQNFYNNTTTGMIGNDDCGQMSAWYIFSTLGFYPVNAANGEFVLGIPQVSKAKVLLSNKKSLSIARKGNSYDVKIKLNKRRITTPTITYSWLKNGGYLLFE